jgi:hypothetical protein
MAPAAGTHELGRSDTSGRWVPAARRAAIRSMRRRAGRPAARLLARLQREQIDLAMVVTHVGPDDPLLAEQREYCRSLRDALAAMPGAAAAEQTAS